jgi:hypothetical protein
MSSNGSHSGVSVWQHTKWSETSLSMEGMDVPEQTIESTFASTCLIANNIFGPAAMGLPHVHAAGCSLSSGYPLRLHHLIAHGHFTGGRGHNIPGINQAPLSAY